MNHPDEFPVDVKEMREWLIAHKQDRDLSWSVLARASGIPAGTISPFVADNYKGDVEKIAKRVFMYRQLVESQEERAEGLPIAPEFIKTPTAMRLHGLLVLAQRGRITVAATGPGTSKTFTIENYEASVANVWIATMSPTTKTLAAMIGEVLRAVGGDNKQGWVRQMSAQVRNTVAGRGGLIVVDEAGHLEDDALEELRSWHDLTGVGICLLGNEELIMRIRGGPKRHRFARLNSRISMSLLQDLPLEEDIEMYLDAWSISNPAMRAMLKKIGMSPGAGGLREIKQIIENACIIVQEDILGGAPDRALSLTDLREAHSTRASRYIRIDA